MVADGAESGWKRRRRSPRASDPTQRATDSDQDRARREDVPTDDRHVVDLRAEPPYPDEGDTFLDAEPVPIAPLPPLPGHGSGRAVVSPPWMIEAQIGEVTVAANEDALAIGPVSLNFVDVRTIRMKIASVQVNKISAITYRVEVVGDRAVAELKAAAGSRSGAEESGRMVSWLLAVLDAKVVPRLVFAALDEMRAGGRVSLGGLSFTREGLSKGRLGRPVPWKSVRGTTLDTDVVLVFVQGKPGAAFVIPLEEDNAFAVPALVDEARRRFD